jgi:type IV secretion system protein TrbL
MGATGDRFLDVVLALVQTGFGLIQNEVFGLTSLMIMATFGILGIKFILSAEESKAVIGQFFMTVLFVGFLTTVIQMWPTLYEQIGTYFQDLGGVAGGVEDAGDMMRRPSRVLETLDMAKAPIEKTMDDLSGGMKGLWNSGKVMSFAFALWILTAAFYILYVNIFFAVVEFHLVALAAWPFLAFSAFKGSAFLAERPLGFVFAAGAKLFVMSMILGFSLNFYDESLPPVNPTLGQAVDAALMAGIIMILGFAVPVAAAALISGGPGLSAALPMATALGAAMVIKEGASAARHAATGGAAKAVGSATATAASRANTSFGNSFAPGGAASTAMSAMRGADAVRPAASATAAAAGAGRGSSAVAGMRSAYNRGPSRAGSGPKTDLLQRVRSAIPPGTEGQASGAAPRLSSDI